MKPYLILLFLFVFNFSSAQNESVKVINKKDLEKILSNPSDTVYILNLWATWCKPCIMELPYFEKVNIDFKGSNVKVILMSLDFKEDLDEKVLTFLKKKNVQSEVLLLDETDYNSWIDTVEKSWAGAIPITLIFNNSKKIRHFIDHEVEAGELEGIINKYINK